MTQPVPTAFDSGSTTTNASSYTTTSKSFTSGRLYLMAIIATGTTAPTDPTVFKFTTNGTAWTKAGSDGPSNPASRVGIWIVKAPSTITDTVTVTFGTFAVTGFDWIIFEFSTNWLDDGTIAHAVQQYATAATGSSTTPSVNLTTAPSPGNLTLGFAFDGNSAFTAGANFTKVTETAGHASPNARMAGEKDNGTPQQTLNWTIASGAWGAWGCEVNSSKQTDAGTASQTETGSRSAEYLVDLGTGAATSSGSRSFEAPLDAGTAPTATIAGSRSTEGPADAGTGSTAATGSRSAEYLADVGTGAAAGAGSRSFEATADLGTGSGTVAGSRSLEATADAGTSGTAIVAASTAAEGPGDAGSGAALTAASASGEFLSDHGTAGASASDSGAETLVDAATVAALIAALGIEVIVDLGSQTITVSGSGSTEDADSGTGLVLIGASGRETIVDVGTVAAMAAARGSDLISDAAAALAELLASGTGSVTGGGGGTTPPGGAEDEAGSYAPFTPSAAPRRVTPYYVTGYSPPTYLPPVHDYGTADMEISATGFGYSWEALEAALAKARELRDEEALLLMIGATR